MKCILFKISLMLLVVSLFACKQKPTGKQYTDTPTSGEAAIGVDETFQPIIESVLPVYHSMYKSAKIDAKYIPEVDAFNLLFKDSLRLIVVSRHLSQKELDYFHSKNFFPIETIIAVDGIAVLVNPSNPDTLLSIQQIRKILLGEITSWKQIDKSSKLGDIKVVFDNPNSSTVRVMVDSVTKTGKLRGDLGAMKYNRDVVDFVSQTPNAIGMIGVSWVSDRNDPSCLTFLKKVRVASLSAQETATAENSFKPYQAYLAMGQYPLTRLIYAITNDPRRGLLTGFAAFMAGDKGQRIIQKTGILPATQPVRLIHVRNKI
jgi:phosphate transport system substrate-binding protein